MSFRMDDLCAKKCEIGRNPDAQKKYLDRVLQLESGIPKEILIDWFQEHPTAASAWSFLDLQSISWEKKPFALKDVPHAEAFKGGTCQFKRLVSDVHLEQVWVYGQVKDNGTWTNPPILLSTTGMQFREEAPEWLKEPLHLAEGYHRVAALHALINEPLIKDEHEFWVGSPTPPTDETSDEAG